MNTVLRRLRSPDRVIRVLMVEDSVADADLMTLALRRAGLTTDVRVVQEERPFRDALTEFHPDVVLVDSKLPRFSGRRALRIANRHDATLPVIMVTGTLREDRIVRLTRLGLTNYVLKDRLLRLAPAVMDGLARAETQRDANRSREALEASEQRFRAVAEASGDGLVVMDQDGTVMFWNAAAQRIFGYRPEEVLGTKATRLIAERVAAAHLQDWRERLKVSDLPAAFTRELVGVRADGQEIPIEMTASGWVEGGAPFFSAVIRDVTARKEEARTRLVLSQAVEQTTSSVIITDTEGSIEYVNPAFERLTGYTAAEVLGKTPRILRSGAQPDGVYRALWSAVTRGKPFSAEFTNRRKDGSEYVQRTTVFPIVGEEGQVERLVGLGQDVTQERLLERQLRQAQKMEAVGQLAGGIAHDFNNILTGVLTNAQLLEMGLPEGPCDDRELLEDVTKAARRGADLVKRLMALSRTSTTPARLLDLRASVDEAARTVRRILPESIELTVEHPDGPVTCHLEEADLHQAIFNLCNNARDAMPDGGLLAVRTRVEGDRAILEVRDNGAGMPPAVVDRIFEPFFTTKEAGKGTGLGLPMVYAFAHGLGGSVGVESRPGAGTLVRLTLPLAPPSAEDALVDERPAPRPEASAANGTVLVAEDQDDLRRVAQKVLERMGYTVLTAADGVDAMAILAREHGRLDLVLADMVMPRGGGGMLYRNSRHWPDQPRFLLTSGFAASELNGDKALLESVPFLPKPWNLVELAAAVARVAGGAVA
jgi:PAS domain S-box-containing protein